jgi:hypothetical protein
MVETLHRQDTGATEARFLKRQADEARAALKACTRETARDALHAVDPRPYLRDRPIATVAIAGAALVGIGAAFVLARKRKQSNVLCVPRGATFISLEKTMTNNGKRGIARRIGGHLFSAVRETLMSALVARGVIQRSESAAEPEYLGAGI